jgi:hypothetical protein
MIDNPNFLSPLGFKFVVKQLPHVNYFCQNVTLPSIAIGAAEMPTPFATIPYPASKVIYDPLVIRFKVDEDLKNYVEIHNWIVSIGHPVSLEQTRDFSRANVMPGVKEGSAATYVSDGALMILTSHKNPSHMISFRAMFPISLSELSFQSTDPGVSYLEATVQFRYLRYDIEYLNA